VQTAETCMLHIERHLGKYNSKGRIRAEESESTYDDSPKRFLAYTSIKSNDTLPQIMLYGFFFFFAPFYYAHLSI
jgi:hypothetical protein